MSYLPITDHGLIGDLHTAALVGIDGRIVWLSWPRFDSPSLFAALLDHERGGDWLLAPTQVTTSRQAYDGETAVLLTEFETPGGRAELRDWMTPWDGQAPSHDLCRTLRCTAGEIEVWSRFAPQPEYATRIPEFTLRPDGLDFTAHDLQFHLTSNYAWQLDAGVAFFRTTLRAGDEVRCVLSSGTHIPVSALPDILEATRRFWQNWINCCTYVGRWHDAVRRSAITLKLLTYAPSGAIVAAPTTSLPEWIGGIRNWDYRYTWLRDASFTLYPLYFLGYRDEAHAFYRWLDDRVQQYGTPLQIMYGIDGEAHLTEYTLDHLAGYRDSRPVRVGNAAYNQKQLDVYGGVVDAAFLYERQGNLLTAQQWQSLSAEINYVCEHWMEPDESIWEMRGPPQHYTFSKLMCWVTLDRAIRIAEDENWEYDKLRWTTTRDAIYANILQHGWNEQAGAFTMAYDSTALDASLLTMPLVGFLPTTDPRIQSTIEQIKAQLGAGALVYRYRMDDHLPGEEGAFLLCSFWMVDVLALSGKVEEATQRFERLLAYAGDHGLLSEEVDPATGTALGNYPQAFSHIGLINSALTLERVQQQPDATAIHGSDQDA